MKKKLKGWQIALLIIFYPVGIIYLIIKLCSKKHKVSDVPAKKTISNRENKSNSDINLLGTEKEMHYKELLTEREENIRKKREAFAAELDAIPRVAIVENEKAKRNQPSDMPEIKFRNITKATNIDNIFPLVVLDVETTGVQARGNDIIEVSAIKFEKDFTPTSCFTTLLKPRSSIPADASSINHITDDMVKDCPPFSKIAKSLFEYISGCNIVGHNIGFDLKFLFVCGMEFPENVLYFDTLDLVKHTLKKRNSKEYDYHNKIYVDCEEYDVENYQLETLCDYYGIFRDDAHRSLSDCMATIRVLQHLIEDKTGKTVTLQKTL